MILIKTVLKKYFLFLLTACSIISCVGDTTSKLTTAEREYLKKKGDITIAIDIHYPPFEMSDENNDNVGLFTDLTKWIALEYGLNLKMLPMSFGNALDALAAGQIDMVQCVFIDEERKKRMEFTDPVFHIPAVIFVLKDRFDIIKLSDLNNKKITSESGDFALTFLDRNKINYKLIETPTFKESFDLLLSKQVDAIVGDEPALLYYSQKNRITEKVKRVGEALYHGKGSYSIKKDEIDLVNIFNKGINKALNDGVIDNLSIKWIGYSYLNNGKFYISKKIQAWLLLSAVIICCVILLIIIWNRTLRKEVNQRTRKIKEMSTYLKGLFDSIPSALMAVSPDGTIKRLNQTALNISIPGAEGMKFWEAVHFLEKFKNGFEQAVTSGKPVEFFRETVDWSEKTYYNIFFFPMVIETEADIVIRLDDITELEKKDHLLLQSQKMETIGILASGLAHDFNNMLGGITGSVSLLKILSASPEGISEVELLEYLNLIEESGERASDMINQLLSISRKQELKLAPVDINLSATHVTNICSKTLDKSIEIHTYLSPEPAMVQADSTQIEQTILNLCVNASHAMTIMRNDLEKQGGIISVSVQKIQADRYFQVNHPEAEMINYWLLSVQDNGVGMDSKTVAKIFDPFFTTKEKGKGTGLGLSMVYNIIKQHRGFVDVYTELSIGTTFRIYLPALTNEYQTEIAGEFTDSEIKGSGTILIIDDERIMREIAGAILIECGYNVIYAEDGEEGVEMFNKHNKEISAVLLDLVMPKKSGREAFHEIMRLNPDAKICLTTGFSQDERVNQIMSKGVKAFVQKPFTYNSLAKGMKDTISQK